MSGSRFGLIALTRERGNALFRQLGWEEGHDVVFAPSKFNRGEARGIDLDVILIDETALPMRRDTWANYAPCLKARNGTVYKLTQFNANDLF